MGRPDILPLLRLSEEGEGEQPLPLLLGDPALKAPEAHAGRVQGVQQRGNLRPAELGGRHRGTGIPGELIHVEHRVNRAKDTGHSRNPSVTASNTRQPAARDRRSNHCRMGEASFLTGP